MKMEKESHKLEAWLWLFEVMLQLRNRKEEERVEKMIHFPSFELQEQYLKSKQSKQEEVLPLRGQSRLQVHKQAFLHHPAWLL